MNDDNSIVGVWFSFVIMLVYEFWFRVYVVWVLLFEFLIVDCGFYMIYDVNFLWKDG